MLYTCESEADRRSWGESWAQRTLSSNFGDQALAYGLSSKKELEEISHAWLEFSENEEAVFYYVIGEILIRV